MSRRRSPRTPMETREARCEAGHRIVVEIEDGKIVAAAERVSPDDTWRFVSCGFCPVCGGGITNYLG